ncbi:hypothetical protein OROHE_010613 [Orobanche hederae]
MEILEKLGKPKILRYSFVILIFVGSSVLTSGFAGSIQDLEWLVLSKRTVRDQVVQSLLWPLEPEVRDWVRRIRLLHNNSKLVHTMSDETLMASLKNSPSQAFLRAAMKFSSITKISMNFLTRENVNRFFTGDFVLVDGYPQFPGSIVPNPMRDSLIEIEQHRKYNSKHSKEDKDIYEVQMSSAVTNVFELPRRYTARGKEVLGAATRGTFSMHIVESSLPFVRIPAGIFIGYIIDHLSNERKIYAKITGSELSRCIDIEVRYLAVQEDGKGIGDELPVNGGLLACFMSKCLKDHLASQNDRRYTVAVHGVDAWYSLDNNPKGPATYIVRGFYDLCNHPKILFVCSKAYASFIADFDQREELIEIKGLRVAGSHACWYQEGSLAISRDNFSKRSW